MGRPKLLLPLGETTIIGRLLDVLRRPEIERTVVFVRPDDEPLRAAAAAGGAVVVQPNPPPEEMRQSVEHALRHIAAKYEPREEDAWLLSPADHPLLDSTVLDALLQRWSVGDCRILIPTHERRRGHPVLFRWDLARDVFALPADVGLNQLVRQHANEVTTLAIDNPAVLWDLDTPEDYERLVKSHST
jgi:molybdenum cofactor cytidylyltransferase